MESKYKQMTVVELKKECDRLNLPKTGLKSDLINRLVKYEKENGGTSKSDSTGESNGMGNEKKRSSAHLSKAEENESSHKLKRAKSSDKNSLKAEIKFHRIREGPKEAAMEKIVKEDKSLSFAKKNLEITNNSAMYYSYTLDYARGNVRVDGGRWYFEMQLLSCGQIQVGWCTEDYHPHRNAGQYWAYDVGKQQKVNSNEDSQRYGDYCGNGDVIGCAIDIEGKNIQFWRNGKDLGVAFSGISFDGKRCCPLVGLSRRSAVLFNFGKEPFSYPVDGYNLLHSFLSDEELVTLTQLYLKYKDIGNAEKNEEDITQSMEIEMDKIQGNGLVQFQKDLGATDEEDPIMLIIAWKLNAKKTWEFSKDEFLNGFAIHGCATMEQIQSKVKEWKSELKHNDLQFKRFYNFVFDYLREDKTVLLLDEVLLLWNIVLKDRHWALYKYWIEFLQAEKKKSISRDVWQQLWHFMQMYPQDTHSYDPSSSWPIIYDDFVEWLKAKKESSN